MGNIKEIFAVPGGKRGSFPFRRIEVRLWEDCREETDLPQNVGEYVEKVQDSEELFDALCNAAF